MRDLDESAWLDVPGLLADLHIAGAAQEVERVVRINRKARQSGYGPVSILDPAYHVIEQSEEVQ